jgi:hypothetical protein
MLLSAKSYPLGLGKLCFRAARAMLLDAGSNAFGPREQCSGPYGACLYIPIEQCSSAYGAMLWRVRSCALTGNKQRISSFKFLQIFMCILILLKYTFQLHITELAQLADHQRVRLV